MLMLFLAICVMITCWRFFEFYLYYMVFVSFVFNLLAALPSVNSYVLLSCRVRLLLSYLFLQQSSSAVSLLTFRSGLKGRELAQS